MNKRQQRQQQQQQQQQQQGTPWCTEISPCFERVFAELRQIEEKHHGFSASFQTMSSVQVLHPIPTSSSGYQLFTWEWGQ